MDSGEIYREIEATRDRIGHNLEILEHRTRRATRVLKTSIVITAAAAGLIAAVTLWRRRRVLPSDSRPRVPMLLNRRPSQHLVHRVRRR